MAIHYHVENVQLPVVLNKPLLNQWLTNTIQQHNRKAGRLTYIFCSDEEILHINRQFLKHDYYTDIITFDYTTGHTVSGDIYISVDTVCSNAETYAVTFEQELYRVMIHGVLHLCGIADESDEERAFMEKNENEALLQLQQIARNK